MYIYHPHHGYVFNIFVQKAQQTPKRIHRTDRGIEMKNIQIIPQIFEWHTYTKNSRP